MSVAELGQWSQGRATHDDKQHSFRVRERGNVHLFPRLTAAKPAPDVQRSEEKLCIDVQCGEARGWAFRLQDAKVHP